MYPLVSLVQSNGFHTFNGSVNSPEQFVWSVAMTRQVSDLKFGLWVIALTQV